MLPTRALTGSFACDGHDYAWELRREPQWCTTDGWQGMLVAVRRALSGGWDPQMRGKPFHIDI